MANNLIKKMPRAIQTIKSINNIFKLQQSGFSKLFKNGDDSKFVANSKAQQNRSFENLALLSLVPGIGTNQKVNNLGEDTLGIRHRFFPSFSVGEAKNPTRNLSSCSSLIMDPRGRVALVTGATGGIGLSIVEELLCTGARVLMVDMDCDLGECTATRLAGTYGWENIQFAQGDVTCYESFEACVQTAICKFQGLDILVNNAGVLTACPRDKVIDINYKSVVFGTRLGFKYMGSDQGKNGGVVVNIASVVGLIGLPGAPIYSATKHGVIGASMSYGDCLTFDRTCVRVCTVCPGCTATEMTASTEQIPCDHFKEGAAERSVLKEALDSLPKQPAARLGPATAHVIRYAPNGSIWVSEDSEVYQFILPDYHSIEVCNSRIKNLES